MENLKRRRSLLFAGMMAFLCSPGCSDYGPGSPGSAQFVEARRENAEQTLRDAGAEMEFKNYGIGKAWTVNLNGKEITDDIVEAILALPYVSELHVSGTAITDEQLMRIGEGKGYWLLVIDVSDTQIGNEGIAFIKELKHLGKLNIKGSQISPEFVETLLKERAKVEGVSTEEVELIK